MIITKIFDINLNIDDINIIFNKDINNTIFNLVKKKYINRCYLDVFIIDINKILNRSFIESDQSNLNGVFSVCIQFEAKCIIYNTNEVITNMVIQDNINNNLSIVNDICVAIIKSNKNIADFKKGEKIPIIVGKAKFNTGSDKIRINAYPFIPIINNKIIHYKISKVTDDEKDKLNEMIIKYIEIEENIKKDILKIKDNKWNYFNDLIYPYKNNISDSIIKKNKTIDMMEMIGLNDKIILLNSEINLSNRVVCVFSASTIDEYIENDNVNILYDIYKKYYLNLKLINDFSTIYDTDNKISSNKHIFNLYIKYKK